MRHTSSGIAPPSRTCFYRFTVAAACAVAIVTLASAGAEQPIAAAVATVGFTVSDADRAEAFFRDVLTFHTTSDREVTGRPFELLQAVFGARARIVSMALGDETIELTEYLAPRGRPNPSDARSNDRSFQHMAIIVSDMDAAYARLREHRVQHASTGPQTLPI